MIPPEKMIAKQLRGAVCVAQGGGGNPEEFLNTFAEV